MEYSFLLRANAAIEHMVLTKLTLVAGGLSNAWEFVADHIAVLRTFDVVGEPAFVEAGAHKALCPPSGPEAMLYDLRLVIDAVGNAENDTAAVGRLSQPHPGGLCGLATKAVHATGLADKVAIGSPCSQAWSCGGPACDVAQWLGALLCQSLCGNCGGQKSCNLSCEMRNGVCMAETAASGGCIDFMASSTAGSRITWEARWDVFVPLRILLGLVLLKGAHRSAKSWMMQALVGVVVGLLFVLSVAWHHGDVEDQDIAELVAAFARGPTIITTQCYEFVSSALERVFAWHDPKYGFPQGQALLTGASIAGGMSGIRLLKDGKIPEEPVGEIFFTIGRDGRRVDKLPAATVPLLQYVFTAMLWMLGASLVLTSTAWPIANVFVFVVVLCWNWLLHFASCIAQWNQSSQPGQYTELISSEEVEMQMEKATAQALESLRVYLSRNPAAMQKVSSTAYDGLKRMVKDPGMKVSALCYDDGNSYEDHSGGFLRSCSVL